MSLEYGQANGNGGQLGRRRLLVRLVVWRGCAAGMLGLYAVRFLTTAGSTTESGRTLYTVIPGTLEIRIKKDGELQAVKTPTSFAKSKANRPFARSWTKAHM